MYCLFLLFYVLFVCKLYCHRVTTQLHLTNISYHFMEPEGSLPHSKMPATCPYPEPARFSLYPHIPLPEDPSEYYPPIYTLPQARYPWVISTAAQSKRFLIYPKRPTRLWSPQSLPFNA